MTIGDINTKITSLINLDASDTISYPVANRLIDINIWLHKIETMLLNSQDESDFDDPNYGNFPIVTTPLTLFRDYNIPPGESVIAIKRVDISYDGATWNRGTPIDVGEFPQGIAPPASINANNTLDGYYSKVAPRYDIAYNSVFIFPKPSQADVTAGGQIQIEWTRELQEFTLAELNAGTKIPGFDTAFHTLLAYGPAYEYAFQKTLTQLQQSILPILQDLEARLIRQYGKKQIDRDLSIRPLLVNYK